jgi:hypothetical protein
MASVVLLCCLARVTVPPVVYAQEVIQGGFRLFDPERPRNREAGVLSLGPLVAAGARLRTGPGEGVTGICKHLVFATLGTEGTKRGVDSVRLVQRNYLVAFFVFTECTGEDEVCLVGASEPVAVSGCGASVKLRKREAIAGKVKVKCRSGIDAADPAFGMNAGEQGFVAEAFPEIGTGFTLGFKEKAGEEVTGEDLDYKIRNLSPAALDDVVGTYLADDDLPLCAG